jgi:aquaporin Z
MKYVYEFIGTFFLMLTVGLTVLAPNNSPLLAPLAIGSALGIFVYAGGHVSGGHYNPAVSFAVFLRGRLALVDLLLYWIIQLVSAVLAGYTVLFLKGIDPTTQAIAAISIRTLPVALAEFLFAFALCFVVLNVATARETEGNSYFGWAIGFTVVVGAFAVGSISGAAFNPAVALGAATLHLIHWNNLWVYFAANLLGAVVAALIFKAAHPNELDHRV